MFVPNLGHVRATIGHVRATAWHKWNAPRAARRTHTALPHTDYTHYTLRDQTVISKTNVLYLQNDNTLQLSLA